MSLGSSYERVPDGGKDVPRWVSKKIMALALVASLFVVIGTSQGKTLTSKMAFTTGYALARTGTALKSWHGPEVTALNNADSHEPSSAICECSNSDCDALELNSVNGVVYKTAVDEGPSVAPTTTPDTDWIVYFSDGILEADGSGASRGRGASGKIVFFYFGGGESAPELFHHGAALVVSMCSRARSS